MGVEVLDFTVESALLEERREAAMKRARYKDLLAIRFHLARGMRRRSLIRTYGQDLVDVVMADGL